MPSKYPFIGDAILFENMLVGNFENMLVGKMLVAEIKTDDVFYNLGCGHAQNLVLAATEYGVKDCIGIENKLYEV